MTHISPEPSVLVVVCGLPGTGKSALADGIGAAIGAAVFSVDPIEAAMLRWGINRDHGSDRAAYEVAGTLADSELRLGHSAILDAVTPIELARSWWRDLATRHAVPLRIIECTVSDRTLHRSRIEGRGRNIPGFAHEPTWDDVVASMGHYEPWQDDRLVVDSVAPLIDNLSRALGYIYP